MVSVAILTADKKTAQLLDGYVRQFESETADIYEVKIFENVLDFFAEYKYGFDVVVIDSVLPKISGIQVAELIRADSEKICIIFISKTAKNAIFSFTYNAVAYLLKPVGQAEFFNALKIAAERADKWGSDQLNINTNGTIVIVGIKNLFSVEVDGHYLHYYTENGEYVERGTMKGCEDKLAPYGFLRCNNSVLVNMRYVTELSRTEITVAGKKYPISHSRAKSLRSKFLSKR